MTPAEPEPAELAEVLGTLRAMLAFNCGDPRARGKPVAVQYEFVTPSGPVSYYCTCRDDEWDLRAGTLPAGHADVIIRTAPDALLAVISGTLGGREAVMSGRMDLRKAPSMPKLLAMRGMFNRYAKAQARRTA